MFHLVDLMHQLLLLVMIGNVFVTAIAMKMEKTANHTQPAHQELNSTQKMKNANVSIQAIIWEMVHAELVERTNSITDATENSIVFQDINILEEDVSEFAQIMKIKMMMTAFANQAAFTLQIKDARLVQLI